MLMKKFGMVLVGTAFLASACGSAREVTREEFEMAEMRLLAPCKAQRAVVANTLEIEVSPNFENRVARPAVNNAIQGFKPSEEGGDVVYRWTSEGGLQNPLRFELEGIEFAILRAATLRVRGSGKEMALRIVASGSVTEAANAGGMRNGNEFRVEDGSYTFR